jgi:iron complex transport system substrate-binding protein
MKLAAERLTDPSLSLREAAAATGYDDVYYFSKLFKKHHGISPGRYRKHASLHS